MTNEKWIKKAGAYLPEGGYNIDTLGKCVFMFKEGYKSAIKDICEWLEDNIYDYLYINRDFNEADYKHEFIEDLRKAMEE